MLVFFYFKNMIIWPNLFKKKIITSYKEKNYFYLRRKGTISEKATWVAQK